MALVLNEEQQLLKDAAVGFFAENAPVSQLRKLRDDADEQGYSTDLWQSMAEMGFCGVLIPEEQGGAGFGLVGAGIIAEAMGTTLAASPWFASSVVAALVVQQLGSDEDKADLLPQIASGEKIVTLALDEGPQFDPSDLVMAVSEDGLKGLKTYVPDGHVADLILVAAKDGDGLAVYLVDAKAENLIIDRTVMTDSRNWAKLTFEGVKPVRRLGSGDATKGLMNALDRANAVVSAELLGISERCLADTTDYLKQREQFGTAIGTFQALQHRASHLYSEIAVSRSAVLKALQMGEGSHDIGWFASVAKARAVKSATLATNEAIQMHGGIGMTDEYDIGFFIKRARPISTLYGGEAWHTDRFARLSGY